MKQLDDRLIDMTLREALDIAKPFLEDLLGQVVHDNIEGKCADEIGHGLNAICEVFGCARSKAVEIHHDKRYVSAIWDDGRKIIVNKTKLYKLIEEERKKRLSHV